MSRLRQADLDRPERLYLTGFMAAGKTTIGARLAARLGWTFVDLDEAVTAKAGRTVPELFAEGEEAFRREEYRMLKQVSRDERRVIALGGGALQWRDALDFVRARGLLVYLRADTDTLLGRLRRSGVVRPLLAGSPDAGLRGRVEQLLAARRPYYESAALIVDCGDRRSRESIVGEILDVLERKLSAGSG